MGDGKGWKNGREEYSGKAAQWIREDRLSPCLEYTFVVRELEKKKLKGRLRRRWVNEVCPGRRKWRERRRGNRFSWMYFFFPPFVLNRARWDFGKIRENTEKISD